MTDRAREAIVYNEAGLPRPGCPTVFRFFTIHHQIGPPGSRRKTPIYSVVNNRSGMSIGEIKWYGPWRQYCFFPEAETVWSQSCLHEIEHVLSDLRKARS